MTRPVTVPATLPDCDGLADLRRAFYHTGAKGASAASASFVPLICAFRWHRPRHVKFAWTPELVTPYVNTIPVNRQPAFPGDLAIEEKLASLMRWNALAMVARANAAYGDLGSHIASYASAADLFEVGFNHFFHERRSRA